MATTVTVITSPTKDDMATALGIAIDAGYSPVGGPSYDSSSTEWVLFVTGSPTVPVTSWGVSRAKAHMRP